MISIEHFFSLYIWKERIGVNAAFTELQTEKKSERNQIRKQKKIYLYANHSVNNKTK